MTYPTSYYAATRNPAPERPPLAGDESCDVCVVGGGFAGVSAALHLAESGKKVILLEAEEIGFGASGRNGGQVVNGFSRGYDAFLKSCGKDTAEAILAMSFEGGDIIRQRIGKYGISCDYREGTFFAAFNKKQIAHLEREKELWERAGNTAIEMIGPEKVSAIVDTKLYIGGMLDRRGGHLHPLNLVLGEAAALESLGGKIFEQSRVIRIDKTNKPKVYTDKGSVAADFVVVCGNAYLTGILPEITGRIMPVSSQIVTTEPLGEELARKMMPGDNCVEDCNFMLDYYRITADHRLLFGGGVLYSGYEPTDVIRRLQPHIDRTFPYLRDKKIDFAWNGQIAITLTRFPHLGRLSDTIYFIQGDSGHGVTACHLQGKLVAEAINHQAARFDVFANIKNYPFPGGRVFRVPLTALGAWYYELREVIGI